MTRTQEEGATDRWISLNQAAALLNTTRYSVLRRIQAGELTAQLVAGRTVVLRDSVEAAVAA